MSCPTTNRCLTSWDRDMEDGDECEEGEPFGFFCPEYRCTACTADEDCGEGRACDETTGRCHDGECLWDRECAPPVDDCHRPNAQFVPAAWKYTMPARKDVLVACRYHCRCSVGL